MENKRKEEIIKKWEESGLLDGLTEMDKDHPMVKVMKLIGKQEINELPDVKPKTESSNETQNPELDISDVISSFFLHYHNKYEGKKIKFIVDKNATVAYGEGKYIMIVEEGKGYDTALEMFFLKKII